MEKIFFFTTEHADNTELLCFHFRVFSVFRGSFFCSDVLRTSTRPIDNSPATGEGLS
jgi:hypothetical protein